jgi:ornithine cyclodeaminase/alanine dehydrogenase
MRPGHQGSALRGAIAIPLSAGELRLEDVTVELGGVLTGAQPGRTSPDQITLFNSVGLPIQDLAAARLVIDAATARGIGLQIDLNSTRTALPVPAL